jgi:basic membrane protein A
VVGSIGAAKDNGKVLWFGTQADQSSLAPALVVCSQVYDWTGMLKDMIAKHKAGTLGGETYTLTLSNGGLSMVYNPGFTLAADIKAAGDAAIDGLKKSTIGVNP